MSTSTKTKRGANRRAIIPLVDTIGLQPFLEKKNYKEKKQTKQRGQKIQEGGGGGGGGVESLKPESVKSFSKDVY